MQKSRTQKAAGSKRSAAWPVLVAVLVAVLGGIWPAAAQVAQGHWQADDVLSKHLIYRMVQDAQGFLWVATDDGVYRYDGYQTVSLNHLVAGRTRLPLARYTLVRGQRNDLWVLCELGLFRYSTAQRSLQVVPLPRQVADYLPGLLTLAADSLHNRLWVQAGPRTVLALSLGQGRLVPGSRHTFAAPVNWLCPTATGSCWAVTTDRRMHHLAVGRPPQVYRGPLGRYLLPLPDTHPQQFVSGCAQYTARPDSQLYEVRRWLPTRFENFDEQYAFAPRLTPGAEQWVAGRSLVRLRWPAGRSAPCAPQVQPQQLANSIYYSSVLYYELFTDALGTEWSYSPSLRGCYRRHHAPSIMSLLSSTSAAYSSRGITRLPDQRLLIGSHSSTLLQAAGQPAGRLSPYAGNRYVFDGFLPFKAGQVLAFDENSFGLLDTHTWQVRWLSRPGGEQRVTSTSLVRGRAGRIWAGSLSGLFWLDAAHPWLHPYTHPSGTRLRMIRAMTLDSAGYLWFATSTGLYRLAPATGQLRHFALGLGAAALPTNSLLSLQAAGPRVWVGTRDQGVLLVDPQQGVVRQLTTATGLPSNTVCSLLADAEQNLWLGTYAGVVRYQPRSGNVALFTRADGLADNECNYQSAFRDADGTLYFGSIKGVTRLVPARLRTRFAPVSHLVFSRIVYSPQDDTLARVTYPQQGVPAHLRLTDDDQATVQVALTDYRSPESTFYTYQLRGSADTSWHATAPVRTIRLRELPVGDYQLVVKARSAHGIAAANTLCLALQVRRTWWKHRGVWAVSALLLAMMAAAYVHGSRRHHRQQQQQFRGRLAHDLHDELGSLLVRASLQAEVLKGVSPSSVGTATNLLGDLQAASQAMRDVVWGIDPQMNTLANLLDRMREHLELTLPLAGRHYEFLLTGLDESKFLSSSMRQHIYAIFKEAVTNSLRHAPSSTLLKVCLEQRPQHLVLRVRDNGHPPASIRRSGTGLRSMNQRAQLLGGQLVAAPCSDGGFEVKLVVHL